MKKLPEVNESFEELYRMLLAPIKSKLLLTGIELGVFNHLSEPRSADAVAEAIGAHPENTRLFLDGLAASDLMVKKNGLYQNTEVTQTFLVEGSPTFMGQMFTFTVQMCNPVLNDLPKLVKEGPPPPSPEADMGSEEVMLQSAISMANNERSGPAKQAVEIVSGLSVFQSFKKMLDLGGGPGLVGIAIVSSHPTMKGVIFDKPAMVKVAETFIKEYEMEDRMRVMGGDYLQDSIGEGYDLIWASGTLNFGKDDINSLMRKIYDALNPGGVFISVHDGLTHEQTKPDIMVLNWVPMALMGQDMRFDQGEIADSMLRVGFESVRSRTLDMPMGPMDLDIGRK
ncbi:MAG: O-methyltransferase [Candidatus Methanolliviera sp. GoM_oil]|nr:MAG: O-methyltransferase [Candidatus Methanolliviera sp. GoM_oil]